MAKAATGRAAGRVSGRAATPAPAADAPPAPRLVGDDAGGAPDGGISEEVTSEPGEQPAAPPPVADDRLTALSAALDGIDPNIILLHTDPIGAAIVLLGELAGKLDEATGNEKAGAERLALLEQDEAKLLAFLQTSPDGYAVIEGETTGDALIRIVTNQAEAIAALTADPSKAAQIEAKQAHAKAEKGEVAVLADLPDTASLTLRFAEDDDKFIASIAPIAIERSELSPFGGRGVLERDIHFPVETPPATIRSAWLIAGAKSVRCEISSGIKVGGGAIVKIPKGHLIF